MTTSFFEESMEQSVVKSQIVSKYFWVWANVISSSKYVQDIAYIDLFAGPGRYKDGTMSTPLLVLSKAVHDLRMCKHLVTIFNDKDASAVRTLEKEVFSIPGIDKLKHKPEIYNDSVGDDIVKMFEELDLIPTLLFIDPWGYKGLSLRLINSVLKDWGCECLFFFNYNRINMGISNDYVKCHMDALFGVECANDLRCKLNEECCNSEERESTIIEYLMKSLIDLGGKYVLPFRFKNANGKRTSHHLIFVSKGLKGYEIMKEVMAKESSTMKQGVPSFEYTPAKPRQRLLFEFCRPLDELVDMLPVSFKGKTLTMTEIYEKHHVGKPFIKKNYKDALNKLETENRIKATPSMKKRRFVKGFPTFADHVKVKFL
jgi:three-Cys-motif partner protein